MSSSARLSDLKSIINELLEVKGCSASPLCDGNLAPLYLAPMRLTGEIPSSFICTSSELMLENENSEGKESHLLLHI
ncbi:hypothetical protein QQP08_002868 [Theobroma cacao]|nr:hypothetical protein QQP08_002868 [Theobroma cacao]